MLRKETLIKELGSDYESMIKQVNIADFTKCIAQYSGIRIQYLKDEVIMDYLKKWCVNKKKFFDMMGQKTQIDIPINYKNPDNNFSTRFTELGYEYPAFYPWLQMVKKANENKISYDIMRYSCYSDLIRDAFKDTIRAEGMAITRFFKQHLQAPDELITKIGAIFENQEISATFTISIDPVDMILASENPYGWNSCYRLETADFSEGHGDGCLAATLDTNSLITYIWNNHGKFSLYNTYEFKDIRYKRMRMTIAVADDFKAIHFNDVYPGKSSYNDTFVKQLREKVETFISNQIGCRNAWKQNHEFASCYREYDYGYSEYSNYEIWIQSDSLDIHRDIPVFNEVIDCPCGCGRPVPASGDDNYKYNGCGFVYENFSDEHYCEYTEEYEECDGDCRNCSIWNEHNAVCELDENEYCERDWNDIDEHGDADFYQSNIVHCNIESCLHCPLFSQHKPEYFQNTVLECEENLFIRKDRKWYEKDKENNLNFYEIENEDKINELDEIAARLYSGQTICGYNLLEGYNNFLDINFLKREKRIEEIKLADTDELFHINLSKNFFTTQSNNEISSLIFGSNDTIQEDKKTTFSIYYINENQ